MKGMGLINLIQEKDYIKSYSMMRPLNWFLFVGWDRIWMNSTEYNWKLYFNLKIKWKVLTSKFIIVGLMFYTTNNLWHMAYKYVS